jgi:hypothetical protein
LGDPEGDEVSAHASVRVGEIVYVNSLNTGIQNGENWLTAYSNLAEALSNAGTPCEIWVAAGTYIPVLPAQPGTRTDSFRMINGVGIYGGFPPTGYPAWEDRDWQEYRTVLSGEIGDPNLLKDNCYHVFYNKGGTTLNDQAILDGFVITNGRANGGDPFHNDGAGMYNSADDSPVIANCLFKNNFAGDDGGGIYNDHSSPTVTNCTFSGNHAGHFGGGIGNYYYSSPNISNCTFTQNSSEYGGGICNNYHCDAVISDSMFSGNTADAGGGIHNHCDSNAAIDYCSFLGNEASESGGGMCNGSSSPVITNCTFGSNRSLGDGLEGGGGICNYGPGSPEFINCIIYNNTAANIGGAVYNHSGGSPMMTNCTLVYNEALHGGCMYNRESSPIITNCILWSNTGNLSHDEFYDWVASPLVTYSDISGGYPGNGNISADPLLANPISGNVHLLPSSPCIDSGSNAAALVAGIGESVYGGTRIYNGTVDIGADEAQGWTCLIYDDDQDSSIEYSEMVNALMDYLTGDLSYSAMVDVLMCYLLS